MQWPNFLGATSVLISEQTKVDTLKEALRHLHPITKRQRKTGNRNWKCQNIHRSGAWYLSITLKVNGHSLIGCGLSTVISRVLLKTLYRYKAQIYHGKHILIKTCHLFGKKWALDGFHGSMDDKKISLNFKFIKFYKIQLLDFFLLIFTQFTISNRHFF